MLILSMIVYGVAFDFFNISGSLYVNMRTSAKIQNSAQGLFMLMTNGIGATIGMVGAQKVIDMYISTKAFVLDKATNVYYAVSEFCTNNNIPEDALKDLDPEKYKLEYFMMGDWSQVWYIFAGYALVVAILFIFLFKAPKNIEGKVA